MKRICTFLILLFISLAVQAQLKKESALYQTILNLDSVLFETYNNCTDAKKLEEHAALYAEDIEFFHDMSGLATSKKDIIASIEKNICGKVKRELVQGSMEMHEIPNYGVVAIGYHKFHNLVENSVSQPSKFISFWRKKDDGWEMAKVVSLH